MVAKLLILLVTEDMDKKFAIFNKLGELTKHIQQIHPLQILLPKNLKSWKRRLEKVKYLDETGATKDDRR